MLDERAIQRRDESLGLSPRGSKAHFAATEAGEQQSGARAWFGYAVYAVAACVILYGLCALIFAGGEALPHDLDADEVSRERLIPLWFPANITLSAGTDKDASMGQVTYLNLDKVSTKTLAKLFQKHPDLLASMEEVRNAHAVTQSTELSVVAIETQLATAARRALSEKHIQEALLEEKQRLQTQREDEVKRIEILSEEMKARFAKTSQLGQLGGVVRTVGEVVTDAVAEASETLIGDLTQQHSDESRQEKSIDVERSGETTSATHNPSYQGSGGIMPSPPTAHSLLNISHSKALAPSPVSVHVQPDVFVRVTRSHYEPSSPTRVKEITLLDSKENEFILVRPGPVARRKVAGSSIDHRLLEDLTSVLATVFAGSTLAAATGLPALPAQLIAGAFGNWLASVETRLLAAPGANEPQGQNSTDISAWITSMDKKPPNQTSRVPAGHIRLARWLGGIFAVQQSVQVQTLAVLAALFLLFTEALRLGGTPWTRSFDDEDDDGDNEEDEVEERRDTEPALVAQVNEGERELRREENAPAAPLRKDSRPSKVRILTIAVLHPLLVFGVLFIICLLVLGLPKFIHDASGNLLINPYISSHATKSNGPHQELYSRTFLGTSVPSEWISITYAAAIAAVLCTLTSIELSFSNEPEGPVADVAQEARKLILNARTQDQALLHSQQQSQLTQQQHVQHPTPLLMPHMDTMSQDSAPFPKATTGSYNGDDDTPLQPFAAGGMDDGCCTPSGPLGRSRSLSTGSSGQGSASGRKRSMSNVGHEVIAEAWLDGFRLEGSAWDLIMSSSDDEDEIVASRKVIPSGSNEHADAVELDLLVSKRNTSNIAYGEETSFFDEDMDLDVSEVERPREGGLLMRPRAESQEEALGRAFLLRALERSQGLQGDAKEMSSSLGVGNQPKLEQINSLDLSPPATPILHSGSPLKPKARFKAVSTPSEDKISPMNSPMFPPQCGPRQDSLLIPDPRHFRLSAMLKARLLNRLYEAGRFTSFIRLTNTLALDLWSALAQFRNFLASRIIRMFLCFGVDLRVDAKSHASSTTQRVYVADSLALAPIRATASVHLLLFTVIMAFACAFHELGRVTSAYTSAAVEAMYITQQSGIPPSDPFQPWDLVWGRVTPEDIGKSHIFRATLSTLARYTPTRVDGGQSMSNSLVYDVLQDLVLFDFASAFGRTLVLTPLFGWSWMSFSPLHWPAFLIFACSSAAPQAVWSLVLLRTVLVCVFAWAYYRYLPPLLAALAVKKPSSEGSLTKSLELSQTQVLFLFGSSLFFALITEAALSCPFAGTALAGMLFAWNPKIPKSIRSGARAAFEAPRPLFFAIFAATAGHFLLAEDLLDPLLRPLLVWALQPASSPASPPSAPFVAPATTLPKPSIAKTSITIASVSKSLAASAKTGSASIFYFVSPIWDHIKLVWELISRTIRSISWLLPGTVFSDLVLVGICILAARLFVAYVLFGDDLPIPWLAPIGLRRTPLPPTNPDSQVLASRSDTVLESQDNEAKPGSTVAFAPSRGQPPSSISDPMRPIVSQFLAMERLADAATSLCYVQTLAFLCCALLPSAELHKGIPQISLRIFGATLLASAMGALVPSLFRAGAFLWRLAVKLAAFAVYVVAAFTGAVVRCASRPSGMRGYRFRGLRVGSE